MATPAQIESIQNYLESLGIRPSTAMPPLWRLLRKMGFDSPPPLFMSFGGATLVLGLYFGVFWGIAMWLISWSRQDMPMWIGFSASVLAGVLFGVTMAFFSAHCAASTTCRRGET